MNNNQKNELVKTHDTKIDPNKLDNSYEMIVKRLEIQYADAKAHAPDKVQKILDFLDDISDKSIIIKNKC